MDMSLRLPLVITLEWNLEGELVKGTGRWTDREGSG